MSEPPPLLELLRLLVAAGLIDGRIFVRDDAADEVRAHAQAFDVREARRRRHLVSV